MWAGRQAGGQGDRELAPSLSAQTPTSDIAPPVKRDHISQCRCLCHTAHTQIVVLLVVN